ncbi:hypothetical protein EVAR_21389_1 [Eumeta japonica]|uniref:Uncharacterized protein n=1 Tax=Eumeta variegata TaxID=151549 RepID=A0A4C1VIW8_EUMVA|nr:hypothetical protein EVAR_21389_1 [Eumeta japonica]
MNGPADHRTPTPGKDLSVVSVDILLAFGKAKRVCEAGRDYLHLKTQRDVYSRDYLLIGEGVGDVARRRTESERCANTIADLRVRAEVSTKLNKIGMTTPYRRRGGRVIESVSFESENAGFDSDLSQMSNGFLSQMKLNRSSIASEYLKSSDAGVDGDSGR